MKIEYPINLYYDYKLDTFKDLKVLTQYTVDLGGDIENYFLEDRLDQKDYIFQYNKWTNNWNIGEEGKKLINELQISEECLINKINNYEQTEVICTIENDGVITIKDKEIKVVISEESECTSSGDADFIEMINIGELVKFYYKDEDENDSILIYSHFDGSFERLKQNLSIK